MKLDAIYVEFAFTFRQAGLLGLPWDGETKGTLRTEVGCNNCGPHLEFCELDT